MYLVTILQLFFILIQVNICLMNSDFIVCQNFKWNYILITFFCLISTKDRKNMNHNVESLHNGRIMKKDMPLSREGPCTIVPWNISEKGGVKKKRSTDLRDDDTDGSKVQVIEVLSNAATDEASRIEDEVSQATAGFLSSDSQGNVPHPLRLINSQEKHCSHRRCAPKTCPGIGNLAEL